MEIFSVSHHPFGVNSYLLISGTSAALVDPGVPADKIFRLVEEHGVLPQFVLLTHGHFDHVLSLREVCEKYKIPAYIHEFDVTLPEDADRNAYRTVFGRVAVFPRPQKVFRDSDEIPLGNERIRVLHTPGHTAGSVSFLCPGFLLTGDTLFCDTVGRADLYSGDGEALSRSLSLLASLPQNLTIYPGHGAPENLGVALSRVL